MPERATYEKLRRVQELLGHAIPDGDVARGGDATVETIRLRCRAHNQYVAELVFGAKFMKTRREEGRAARRAS
jgi:hypothetical protein